MSRQVFETEMVAHLWANRSQPSARNAGGNFFYTGEVIYSYGAHFPIARWLSTKRGTVILFTTDGYSNTTAKQKGIVRTAIPSRVTVFEVPTLDKPDHKKNVESYRKRIAASAKAATKARTRGDELAQEARDLAKEANEYAAFFGLKTKFAVPSEADLLAAEEKAKAAAKREAKAIEARKAKRATELAETAAEWMRGECDSIPHEYPHILLRVKGSRLMTSRGAIVELAAAKKLLPLVRAGRVWERNGQQIAVGDFSLDRIDAAGNVTIGCHTIQRIEIERLAAQLGL